MLKDGGNQSGSMRRQGCIPEFLPLRGVRLVGGVWASPPKACSMPQRPSSPSTIGILQGGIRCPDNKLEAHTHNSIGGSQTHHKFVTTTTHKWESKMLRFSTQRNPKQGIPQVNEGEMKTAWWRCRSRPSPSILQESASLGGGIERDLRFGELLVFVFNGIQCLDELPHGEEMNAP